MSLVEQFDHFHRSRTLPGAMTAKPFHVEITGERRDTETVMCRLEGGDWKSASNGNSLVAYPTARPVLKPSRWGDLPA